MSSDIISDRLNGLKKHIVTVNTETGVKRLPGRYSRMATELGGELVNRPEGTYCLVKKFFPEGTVLGQAQLEEVDPDISFSCSAFSALEESGEVTVADLLFFDIETTGLGGAGTVAFLIGCGSVIEGGFEVRQYLLPDYTDETAVLEQVLEELSPDKTIVSYNGAAFDLSLVRDRMIVNRVAREIKTAGHIDLLHSVRRLFKRRLGDCSLGSVERELLGFYREEDIPGYLIPSVYFDWLSEENLEDMAGVMEHNQLDIFSLYFLLSHIDRVFRTEGACLENVADIYSLSRVYGRRKKNEKVIELYRSMGKSSREPLTGDILYFHSLAMKRNGCWDEAVNIWQTLSETAGRESYLANLELAKYFEHREKNVEKALGFARKAHQLCPDSLSQQEHLKKRLERLSLKLQS
ncbi:MAG: ribonuclease H-like domain-containing protein [candidate division Zixibacteria bacterium]|nr:ribonuclease H-like domain-containing protein [candidate division Zixibacteria bacterium]